MTKYIETLLAGEEVVWKTLGEVAERIFSGGTPSTTNPDYWDNGTIPWMSSGEVNLKVIDKTEKYISLAGLNNSSAKLVPPNSVVIALAGQGKTRGKVARTRIELATNQSLASLTFDASKISSDYVYYYLEGQYEKLRQISSGEGTRGGLNLQMINTYPIPIPPLRVQRKIVEVLDNFTELTEELTMKLTAELTARRKQYEYFRNELLSFKNVNAKGGGITNVKFLPLGEVGTFVRGSGLQKKDLIDNGVPAIHYGQIYTYYKTYTTNTKSFVSEELAKSLKKVNCGDVIITNTSENLVDVCTAVAYLVPQQGVTGGHATIFKPSDMILPKYLVYYTQTEHFYADKRKYARGTKVIDVNATDLAKITIPIPPIEEQRRIVEILDQFDTLTQSITEGLPREIELRRKQYEYYREQLLSFN